MQQILVHECMHGLGFISSWRVTNGLLMPGQLSNNRMSLEASNAFDQFLVYSPSGVWMKAIDRKIRSALNSSTTMSDFAKSEAGILSSALTSNMTFGSYILYYPANKKTLAAFTKSSQTEDAFDFTTLTLGVDYGVTVMYTPPDYSLGSSFSHCDNQAYDGSSEYLMRPYGTAGISLQSYFPRGKHGPLGSIVLGVLRGMGYATSLGPMV